jgi:hypothetical protein
MMGDVDVLEGTGGIKNVLAVSRANVVDRRVLLDEEDAVNEEEAKVLVELFDCEAEIERNRLRLNMIR